MFHFAISYQKPTFFLLKKCIAEIRAYFYINVRKRNIIINKIGPYAIQTENYTIIPESNLDKMHQNIID